MRWWRRSQRDFENEIRAHLEIETDRLVEEGLAPDLARAAARRKFGNVTAAQERYHDGARLALFADVGKDIRYALRTLAKSPSFTIVAVITLALGIGATTAVFSVVDAVLLRPLPYREPARIAKLWETLPTAPHIMVAYPDYLDWKARNRVFEDVAIYTPFPSMTMTGADLPERVAVGYASANLFSLLGISPLLGRGFRAEDDQPGAARVMVVADDWWRRRFAGETSVVGRRYTFDGEPYTIIGVAPPTPGLGTVQAWIPIGLFANTPDYNRGNHPGTLGVGRLKPGITVEQMNQDLSRIAAEIRAEHPTEASGVGAGGDILGELMVHDIRPALKVLSWAVGLVLLIACANVANLLLGRSSTRRREIAVRTAMGATRGRIVRLLVVENLLLSLVGGALGVALAWAGIRVLLALRPTGIPRLTSIHVDASALAFAALVSIVTGLAFGLIPARRSSRVDLNDALKDGGRGASSGRSPMRMRNALMTTEVALAMMLIVGAGLLIRSFTRLSHVSVGVDANNVATASIGLPPARYDTPERQNAALSGILQRVRAIPGVTHTAAASALPVEGNTQIKVTFEGHPRAVGAEPLVNVNFVTPDFFETLKIRQMSGRFVGPGDVKGTLKVAVISESVASKYFPDENPIGKRIVHGALDSKEPPYTVVGVVSDVREDGLSERSPGTIYLAWAQDPLNRPLLLVRSTLPEEQLFAALRNAVADFDHDLPLNNPAMLADVISKSIGQERFTMFVLAIFAGVALLLAAVGVYGVIAYFVAQRTHEIGVRMALGAERIDIISLIGGRVLFTTAAGVALGLTGAAIGRGLMTKLLYEITSADVPTYTGAALTLIGAAVLAAVVPTLRATRVNPASTIRVE